MTNDDLVKGPTPFKKRHEPGNSGEGDQKRPRDERKERKEPKEIPKAFGEPKKSTVWNYRLDFTCEVHWVKSC